MLKLYFCPNSIDCFKDIIYLLFCTVVCIGQQFVCLLPTLPFCLLFPPCFLIKSSSSFLTQNTLEIPPLKAPMNRLQGLMKNGCIHMLSFDNLPTKIQHFHALPLHNAGYFSACSRVLYLGCCVFVYSPSVESLDVSGSC